MKETILSIMEIAEKNKIPVVLAVRWVILENEANFCATQIIDLVGLDKFVEFAVEFAELTMPLSQEEKEMYSERFKRYYERLRNFEEKVRR